MEAQNQLTAQDLALYLGCECITDYGAKDKWEIDIELLNLYQLELINEITPILRPLSEITDGERVVLKKEYDFQIEGGMLKFKNLLAAVAMLALTAPALQVLALTERPMIDSLPAMPIGEVSIPDHKQSPWPLLAQRPAWHYSGLLAALVWSCFAAAMPRRRNRKAKQPPATAKAPMA